MLVLPYNNVNLLNFKFLSKNVFSNDVYFNTFFLLSTYWVKKKCFNPYPFFGRNYCTGGTLEVLILIVSSLRIKS